MAGCLTAHRNSLKPLTAACFTAVPNELFKSGSAKKVEPSVFKLLYYKVKLGDIVHQYRMYFTFEIMQIIFKNFYLSKTHRTTAYTLILHVFGITMTIVE